MLTRKQYNGFCAVHIDVNCGNVPTTLSSPTSSGARLVLSVARPRHPRPCAPARVCPRQGRRHRSGCPAAGRGRLRGTWLRRQHAAPRMPGEHLSGPRPGDPARRRRRPPPGASRRYRGAAAARGSGMEPRPDHPAGGRHRRAVRYPHHLAAPADPVDPGPGAAGSAVQHRRPRRDRRRTHRRPGTRHQRRASHRSGRNIRVDRCLSQRPARPSGHPLGRDRPRLLGPRAGPRRRPGRRCQEPGRPAAAGPACRRQHHRLGRGQRRGGAAQGVCAW